MAIKSSNKTILPLTIAVYESPPGKLLAEQLLGGCSARDTIVMKLCVWPRRTTIRGLSRVLERLPHRRNGRAQARPLCFGGRRQSSNHHLGDCELSQVNERRVSRSSASHWTVNHQCCLL
jgi:hypothetical protein